MQYRSRTQGAHTPFFVIIDGCFNPDGSPCRISTTQCELTMRGLTVGQVISKDQARAWIFEICERDFGRIWRLRPMARQNKGATISIEK
jgi:hypothetical protein